MKHLGDIKKIDGHTASVVDVVIGGSPCQDLSIAGKRAGLAGERSGLYMEQIRIIKEMRERDRATGRAGQFIRPRYMVWENVPGAFSSNGGADFAAVLEEAIKIAEPEAPSVSVPEKGWPTSGCIMGDEWSVAWRVLDAQFWGVPQRRRRIALVADFGGQSAPEILFVRKSLSGHPAEGGTPRETAAGGAEGGAGGAVWCLQGNGIDRADTAGCNGKGWKEDISYTLNTVDRPAVCAGFKVGNSAQARGVGYADEQAPTLGGECGGNKAAVVYDARGNGDGATVPTITGDHNGRITEYTSVGLNDQGGSSISADDSGVAPTIRAEMHGNVPCVMKAFGKYEIDDIASSLKARDYKGATDLIAGVNCRNGTESPEINGTIQAHSNGGQSLNCNQVVRVRRVVRRLTPLECERLQGFPDGWTDIGEWVESKGKRHKPADTPRYKALGNSIALPPWKWVLKRLCAQYERDATMASLFDGIGGFPLIWEQLNGRGSCLWASEIEEFPMAVTKRRF